MHGTCTASPTHPLCGQRWWHCPVYADHRDPGLPLLAPIPEPKPFPRHSAVRGTKAEGGIDEHSHSTPSLPAKLGHSLFIHWPKVHLLPGLPHSTCSSRTSWGCPVDHHTQHNTQTLPENTLINLKNLQAGNILIGTCPTSKSENRLNRSSHSESLHQLGFTQSIIKQRVRWLQKICASSTQVERK